MLLVPCRLLCSMLCHGKPLDARNFGIDIYPNVVRLWGETLKLNRRCIIQPLSGVLKK